MYLNRVRRRRRGNQCANEAGEEEKRRANPQRHLPKLTIPLSSLLCQLVSITAQKDACGGTRHIKRTGKKLIKSDKTPLLSSSFAITSRSSAGPEKANHNSLLPSPLPSRRAELSPHRPARLHKALPTPFRLRLIVGFVEKEFLFFLLLPAQLPLVPRT